MIINKLVIKNYKLFEMLEIKMNEKVNIFVGENDAGKTTILEAISIVLTGKINGISLINKLNPDLFNNEQRQKYLDSLKTTTPIKPPKIDIEAYFDKPVEGSQLLKYKGTNNSLKEDAYGVKVSVEFNENYSETYKELLKDNKIDDIPIELYTVKFNSFAGSDYYLNTTKDRLIYIDTTKKDYGSALNKFVSSSVSEYLEDEDKTNLRLAYRSNRKEFNENVSVKKLNEKFNENYNYNNKDLTLKLRETDIDGWKNEMSLSIDGIPFENAGFGTQNIVKSEIVINQNSTVDIIIFEEPETNLSFTNMSKLISKISKNDKQIFISTHSSYVANKLGLQNLHLISNKSQQSFTSLTDATYNYFLKLSGYNTLRLLLANEMILVEGPADELIVQRAYLDNHGKLPIEFGIDVMAVGGLAFKRYCELATLISKGIKIVTDNDGNYLKVEEKYKDETMVSLYCEQDNDLNTLEPSVLFANKDNLDEFKKIIYKGNDIDKMGYEDIKNFMIANKTEWSMRVFLSDDKIDYPTYILNAIGVVEDEE